MNQQLKNKRIDIPKHHLQFNYDYEYVKTAIPKFLATTATGLLAGAFVYGLLNVVPTFYEAHECSSGISYSTYEPQQCNYAATYGFFHYHAILVCIGKFEVQNCYIAILAIRSNGINLSVDNPVW